MIAALEVASAVLIPFSVVLTVPLAVTFTAFSAFRAVVLIIFCPCCRVFINCDFAVWETSVAEERLAAPRRICKPCCSDIFCAAFCSAALTARLCLKSIILSFALLIFSCVVLTAFCPCLLNWWIPSSFTRSAA